ncbi:MAG TPA: SUMF1/EgtB/PvdO family nonheme iron enzyme, partial [Chthonomonadales bacterium]|nr:SUMF1/EgtB/PvdO family nonheme iron enzyme [Chthonomonadales bacterium]
LVRDGYAWEFAMQHECQHQETITELLQLIHQAAGVEEPRGPCDARPPSGADCFSEIFIRGGAFIMGSNCRHGYDNEKQEHETEVHSFYLDAAAVTVADWLRFIGDGGYRRPELWQPEGWEWKAAQLIEAPEYWLPNWKADAPRYFGPFGVRSTQLNEPVTSVSWFEADAYSRWAGKRLPTEEEWEYAAAWDAAAGVCRKFPWGEEQPDGVLADFGGAGEGPAPVGAHPLGRSAQGVGEMAGGVWEWTSSRFLPYPGFAAFPYDGYSAEHMDGSHYVCRGGSWASAAPILRCSFRNWYVPTYRQGFLGLRCAR